MKKHLRQMLLAFILILLLPAGNLWFTSCCGELQEYKLISVTNKPLKITGVKWDKLTELKHYLTANMSQATDTLAYDSLMLELVSITALALHSSKQTWGDGFTAYACTQKLVYPVLSSVTIVSNQDYSAAFPAGKNLAGIFGMSQDKSITPLPVSMMAPGDGDGQPFYFTLSRKPDQVRSHTFVIYYTLSDGQVFKTITAPLTIR